jgi:hypothetical protein
VISSQQDRQRVMDQLKITLFPSGPGAYLASTYDENTANPYPKLPDPLTFNDGSKVKNASQWNRRRAEIVEMFDREVYGRRPKNIPKVTWTIASTTEGVTANVPRNETAGGPRRQLFLPGIERDDTGNAQHAKERERPRARRSDVRWRRRRTGGRAGNDAMHAAGRRGSRSRTGSAPGCTRRSACSSPWRSARRWEPAAIR